MITIEFLESFYPLVARIAKVFRILKVMKL